jgi:chromosome segregation ATPase
LGLGSAWAYISARGPCSAGCDDGGSGRDVAHPLAGALAALEGAVAGLREQLDAANGRAERADAALTAERARADGLRDRLNAQSDDLSFVKAALDRTQAEARAARERAEALQREDKARKARGLLARLRAAVRGE